MSLADQVLLNASRRYSSALKRARKRSNGPRVRKPSEKPWIALCRLCGLRRVYGRFQDCLACRMDQRDQDNQERRRRKQIVVRRLGPREVEVALNWERKQA